MTREEAIAELKRDIELDNDFSEEYITAVNMAIKALEQEPCEDCISKKAVLDKINEVCFSREQEAVDFRVSQGSNGQRDLIINFIENLPSVKPKPKTEVLDKIRAEIDCQEKWLMSAGCNAYNVDIAFDTIKAVLAESEE